MRSLKLPPELENQFRKVIQDNYQGDLQAAILAFVRLHEKYSWKEQLYQDIAVIRAKVQARGGISEQTIERTIQQYRTQKDSFESLEDSPKDGESG